MKQKTTPKTKAVKEKPVKKDSKDLKIEELQKKVEDLNQQVTYHILEVYRKNEQIKKMNIELEEFKSKYTETSRELIDIKKKWYVKLFGK